MTGLRIAMSVTMASSLMLGCHHEPTYYEDVAPILEDKCMHCHRAGGVAATPTFGSFEKAAAAAGQIRRSVQSREMPPWGAENSGLCGTWHDALWLRDDEMQVIDRWTKNPLPGDASRGKPATPRPPAEFRPSGVVLDIGGDYRPWLGASASRCFVVGPADDRDRTATAFRIMSTEPRSVQQVTLYAIDSAEGEAAATELDGEDPALGYSCYGSTRVPGSRLLTSWTWDSPVSSLPSGVGVRVPGGRKLVVQIHYNPIATGLDAPTRTRIELAIDDRAPVARYFAVSPDDFRLPPGQFHAEVRAEAIAPSALRVLGVVPRMHTLARAMQLDRSESETLQCMGSFDHWEFSRQRLFSLEHPVDVRAGARLRVTCSYNTEGLGRPVPMGERFDEEECRADLLVLER